jgi:hypothetical protein
VSSASRHRRRGVAPLRPRAPAGLAATPPARAAAGLATTPATRAAAGLAATRATRAAAGLAAMLATLAALLGGGPLGRASAAPLRSCTPTHGTIVAVDFAHWGGPIVRGCGVGRRTGYALLHAAGFTTAGDEHDGPAIVCRLGDAAFHHGTQYPTPNQESCVQTPPTTGYWAYWIAPAGTNHWTYSPLGAMGDVPKPGEVELWIFGATNVAGTRGTGVPTFSPATLRAHAAARTHPTGAPTHTTTARHTSTATRTSTATTTTRTTTSRQTSTTSTTTRTTTHHASNARRRSAHRAARSARRGRAAHRPPTHRHRPADHRRAAQITGTSTTSTTRAGGAPVVAARPTSRRASAGSATPLIIGVALVLVLCAGAGRAIWARRHEQ